MSSPQTLRLLAGVLALAVLAGPAAARERRSDAPDRQRREALALVVEQLLPPPVIPDRRFAPVPTKRAPSPAEVVIYVDRELIWSGPLDEVPSGVAGEIYDVFVPEPILPPHVPPFDHDREICVGTVMKGDTDGRLDVDGMLMDCELFPVQ